MVPEPSQKMEFDSAAPQSPKDRHGEAKEVFLSRRFRNTFAYVQAERNGHGVCGMDLQSNAG